MKITCHAPDKVLITKDDERVLINAVNLLQKIDDAIKINHISTEETTSPGCRLTFDKLKATEVRPVEKVDTKNSLKIETVISMLQKIITTYTISETEIKENDFVLITDGGRCYPTYVEWMKRNFKDNEESQMKIDLGFVPKEGLVGKVIKIAPHTRTSDKNIYCVDIGGRYYLMGENGISKDLDMRDMFV